VRASADSLARGRAARVRQGAQLSGATGHEAPRKFKGTRQRVRTRVPACTARSAPDACPRPATGKSILQVENRFSGPAAVVQLLDQCGGFTPQVGCSVPVRNPEPGARRQDIQRSDAIMMADKLCDSNFWKIPSQSPLLKRGVEGIISCRKADN